MSNNTGSNRRTGTTVITLDVEGMSCTGCEHRIGNSLRRAEGVRETTADHTTGKVQVRVGPGVALGVLAAKITAAGYTVTGSETVTDAGTAGEPDGGSRDD